MVHLMSSQLYLYAPISHITNFPQGASQSVQHTTPSILGCDPAGKTELWKESVPLSSHMMLLKRIVVLVKARSGKLRW